jgi:protein-tyrosine phosphatase
MERTEEYPDIVVRIYSLQMNDTIRVFVHPHFVSWPDLGVPKDPQQLLSLILKYRTSDTYTKAWPLLVHCSAGVGRTGTFLLTDAMFEMARETGRVDFLAHLAHIRNQRISVVEKPEQYRLAHMVILEAYKQGYLDKENNLKSQNTQNWKIGSGPMAPNTEHRTGHHISNTKGTTMNNWSNDQWNSRNQQNQWNEGQVGQGYTNRDQQWNNNRNQWNNQKKQPMVNAHVEHENDGDIVIRITKEPRVAVPCAA